MPQLHSDETCNCQIQEQLNYLGNRKRGGNSGKGEDEAIEKKKDNDKNREEEEEEEEEENELG